MDRMRIFMLVAAVIFGALPGTVLSIGYAYSTKAERDGLAAERDDLREKLNAEAIEKLYYRDMANEQAVKIYNLRSECDACTSELAHCKEAP